MQSLGDTGHDLRRVERHGLEGVDRDEDWPSGRVDGVGVVPPAQRVEDGHLVAVRQADEVVDAPHHAPVQVVLIMIVVQLAPRGRLGVQRQDQLEVKIRRKGC